MVMMTVERVPFHHVLLLNTRHCARHWGYNGEKKMDMVPDLIELNNENALKRKFKVLLFSVCVGGKL